MLHEGVHLIRKRLLTEIIQQSSNGVDFDMGAFGWIFVVLNVVVSVWSIGLIPKATMGKGYHR